ncbi:hypothetical protein [Burkholderia gladioli]|nr:hypothetical protein [Burkholderia gladioli]
MNGMNGKGSTGMHHSTKSHSKTRANSSAHGANSKAGDAVNGNTNGMSPAGNGSPGSGGQ